MLQKKNLQTNYYRYCDSDVLITALPPVGCQSVVCFQLIFSKSTNSKYILIYNDHITHSHYIRKLELFQHWVISVQRGHTRQQKSIKNIF